MEKKKIRINESDLREMIRESVRSILAEDFQDNALSALVREHGGLVPAGEGMGRFDARANRTHGDLRNVNAKGYLDVDKWSSIINMFNAFVPLSEQILCCNDGGVVVLDGPLYDTDQHWKDVDRTTNYLQDKEEARMDNMPAKERIRHKQIWGSPSMDGSQGSDATPHTSSLRKSDHYARRGVRTTGPNAGQKRD